MRTISLGVTLIERDDWGARSRLGSGGINPTRGATGHWEGGTMGWPWAHETCYSLVRGIQAFHMDGRGWVDIAYNLVPCPHGYVFEGRGAGVKSAGHGEPGNSQSYAICFLSGVDDEFTPEQHIAFLAARQMLIDEGGASEEVLCHRDWMNTQCPGDERCGWIKAGLPSQGTAPPAVDPPAWQPDPPSGPRMLSNIGAPYMQGQDVSDWQGFLVDRGLLPADEKDGFFGPKTEAATKEFQRQAGISDDGVVGPDTLAASASSPPPDTGQPDIGEFPLPNGHWYGPPDPDAHNHSGFYASEPGIVALQGALIRLGYDLGAGGDDGKYGDATAAAVTQFQRDRGLTDDGLAGINTWSALRP